MFGPVGNKPVLTCWDCNEPRYQLDQDGLCARCAGQAFQAFTRDLSRLEHLLGCWSEFEQWEREATYEQITGLA